MKKVEIGKGYFDSLLTDGMVVPRDFHGYGFNQVTHVVGKLYKVMDANNKERMAIAECTQDAPFNLKLVLAVGDTVRAWDGDACKATGGDEGDNDHFFRLATVCNIKGAGSKAIIDVESHDGRKSDGLFYNALKLVEHV